MSFLNYSEFRVHFLHIHSLLITLISFLFRLIHSSSFERNRLFRKLVQRYNCFYLERSPPVNQQLIISNKNEWGHPESPAVAAAAAAVGVVYFQFQFAFLPLSLSLSLFLSLSPTHPPSLTCRLTNTLEMELVVFWAQLCSSFRPGNSHL